MVRKIIVPSESTYLLQLPKKYIGRTVEVIAFEVEEQIEKDMEQTDTETLNDRIKYLKAVLENSRVDLSEFKFDRDQANDYE